MAGLSDYSYNLSTALSESVHVESDAGEEFESSRKEVEKSSEEEESRTSRILSVLTCKLGQKRGRWSSPLAFVFATMSQAIGLGNLWVFTGQVAFFGGFEFVIAYWIIFLLCIYPVFFSELVMGQFSGEGPIRLFANMMPAMEGIGLTFICLAVLNAFFYTGRVAHAASYFFFSMQSPMPWTTCNNPWNTKYCFLPTDYVHCVESSPNPRWYLKGSCYDEKNFTDVINVLNLCFLHPEMSFSKDGPIRNELCGVAFDFQPNIISKILRNDKWKSEKIFKAYTERTNEWNLLEDPKDIERGTKLRLDLHKQSLDRVRKMNSILGAHNLTFKDFMEDYCRKEDGNGFTGISCYRKVMISIESFSSEEFYNHLLNDKGASLKNLGGIDRYLILSLGFCWLVIALGVGTGVFWMGRALVVLSALPFVLVCCHLGHAASLPGFKDGLLHYTRLRSGKAFANPTLWISATKTMCFSLGVGVGMLPKLASHNNFRNDILKDSLAAAVGDSIFSFIAGFGYFGILGFLSSKLDCSIDGILEDRDFGFTVFTAAMSLVKLPNFWSLVYFATVFLVSVTSSMVLVETVLSSFFDQFQHLRPLRLWILAAFSTGGYLLSLPFISKYGPAMVDLVDSAIFDLIVPVGILVEVVSLVYVFGVERFFYDASLMLGKKRFRTGRHCGNMVWNSWARWYYRGTLYSSAPFGIGIMIVGSLVVTLPRKSSHYSSAQWAIYWMIFALLPSSCAFSILYSFFRRKITIRKLFKPLRRWRQAERHYEKLWSKERPSDSSSDSQAQDPPASEYDTESDIESDEEEEEEESSDKVDKETMRFIF